MIAEEEPGPPNPFRVTPEQAAERRRKLEAIIGEQAAKEAAERLAAKQWEAAHEWTDPTLVSSVGPVTEPRQGHEGADEWTPPVPLPGTDDVPEFPLSALPPWARDWAEAESEALQTPVDLAALLVLGVVSAALAKKIVVCMNPGWHEPVNLYVAIALPSGEGKSPVFRHATHPLTAFEKDESKRLAPLIEKALNQQQVLHARATRVRRQIAAADDAGQRQEVERELGAVQAELSELKIPARPRFLADDVTMESLAQLMLCHGGRMAVFSSEGGPFEIMAGRYRDDGVAFELYLKAFSGDHLAVDRITRSGGVIYEPILTVVMTVQPAVIAGLGAKEGFRHRGLLARFAYVLPKSRVGTRKPDPASVPQPIAERYAAAVRHLILIPTNVNDAGEIAGHGLDVDAEARRLFVAFKAELEPNLAPGCELEPMADWVNKLPGLALRIAGILHMAGHAERIEGAVARPIAAETMTAAIAIGRYLLAHARAGFCLMAADPLIEDARLVLAYIRRKGLATVTHRDLHRGMQSRFRKSANLDPVVAILTRHGFLRELASPTNPKGGRPERRFAINPIPSEPSALVTKLTESGPGGMPPTVAAGGSVSSVTDFDTPASPGADDDPARHGSGANRAAEGIDTLHRALIAMEIDGGPCPPQCPVHQDEVAA